MNAETAELSVPTLLCAEVSVKYVETHFLAFASTWINSAVRGKSSF